MIGVDQSRGMLEQARLRGGADELHHVALQDLGFDARFDAALTIDAMENVAPEDWPVVLRRVSGSLRPGAPWYLTVEDRERSRVEAAFRDLSGRGLPVVMGEVIEGDVAGYHFYPSRDQVLAWFHDAGLSVVAEHYEAADGWGYWHFIVRSSE